MFDQLICVAPGFREAVGKTFRASAAQVDDADVSTRFVTQVTLYARELGLATVQISFDKGASNDGVALNVLLSMLELEGVLI